MITLPTAPSSQLVAYLSLNGQEVQLDGRDYRIDGFKIDDRGRWRATAHTIRAEYRADQIVGRVVDRPGAELWTIMRSTGGGKILAKFAVHEGRLVLLK